MVEVAKEMFGSLINSSGDTALDEAVAKLKLDHPNLEIIKLDGDSKYLAEIRFAVSKSRVLYVKFPKSTSETEIGIV